LDPLGHGHVGLWRRETHCAGIRLGHCDSGRLVNALLCVEGARAAAVVARVKESCKGGRVQLWSWGKRCRLRRNWRWSVRAALPAGAAGATGVDVACLAVSPGIADVLDLYGLSCDRAASKLD
jgi:hypothetical protein